MKLALVSSGVLTFWLAAVLQARAATIWDGPVMTFSEATTDATLPSNQDRITPNVWITRNATRGIFNAKTESLFTHFFSPADTEWANGSLANYASLTYSDWNTWAKTINGGPPSTVGVNAVVHLKTDDIYVGIKFTSWGGSSGLFSYQRTTPHVDTLSPIPLLISRAGTNVVLTWTNSAFSLQSAANLSSSFSNISGATSPYTNSAAGGAGVFRLIH